LHQARCFTVRNSALKRARRLLKNGRPIAIGDRGRLKASNWRDMRYRLNRSDSLARYPLHAVAIRFRNAKFIPTIFS
jgi:hypothetical protein